MKLKPIVMIGQNGLTDKVQNEITIALQHHELIKIRIAAMSKVEKIAMIETICNRTQAVPITSIGNIAIIYRRTENLDRFSKLLSENKGLGDK